jgi:acyl carrier protein
MESNPPFATSPALARFPAAVLDAFQRYRTKGDAGAVEEVVIAAVVDFSPSGPAKVVAVSPGTRLLEDLGYDSVAVAELVFFLEDVFDLTFANEDLLGVSTIGDLRGCIIRKLAGKSSTA